MERADYMHLLNALESAEAELESLEEEYEWFSSDSLDQIKSAKEIVLEKLEEGTN